MEGKEEEEMNDSSVHNISNENLIEKMLNEINFDIDYKFNQSEQIQFVNSNNDSKNQDYKQLLDDYMSTFNKGIYGNNFDSRLLSLINSKDGYSHFQNKAFNSLPQECFEMMYKLMGMKYIGLLKHHYSSFFCQHLFYYLSLETRKDILTNICQNMGNLHNNNSGQCSVIFIFENNLTKEEKKLVMQILSPDLKNLIWNPMFMRIAECLVVRFMLEDTIHIIEYCISNIFEFLRFREGYFLIRIIVKSAKQPYLQKKILDIIEYKSNFFKLSKTSNGSLLIQCIIYNFPLDFCYFEKSCSKHLLNEEDEKLRNQAVNNNKDNKEIKRLNDVILLNISNWDNKLIKQVVECAIKKSPSFENSFISKVKNDNKMIIISQILDLKYGFKFIQLMFSNFSETNNSTLMSIIKSFKELLGGDRYELNEFYHKYKSLIKVNLTKEKIQNKLQKEPKLYFTEKLERIENNLFLYTMTDTMPNQTHPYLNYFGSNPNFSYLQQQNNVFYQNNWNNSLLYNTINDNNPIVMTNYNSNNPYYSNMQHYNKQHQSNNKEAKGINYNNLK